MHRSRNAFTLVELLVVVAVIGILIGLLLPAVQAAREAARRASCSNNIMQLAIAVSNYEMAHRTLPPGTVNASGPIMHLPIGFHHNWIVQILPMLEENVAYKKLDHRQSIYSRANFSVRSYSLNVLRCPSSPGFGDFQSSYAAVHDSREVPIDVDNNGVMFLNSRVRYDDISDGSSHTLLLGEKLSDVTELGWSSGTRASLRNVGSPINQTLGSNQGIMPPGFVDGFLSGQVADSDAPNGEEATAEDGSAGNGADAAADDKLIETQEDLSNEPDDKDFVRQKESKSMGVNPLRMSSKAPKMWLAISELPAIIPGKANSGSDVGGFASYHSGGACFASADGAYKFISQTIDANVLQQMGNRADGTLIRNEPW